MTAFLPNMSATVSEVATTPQQEQQNHDEQRPEQVPEAFARVSGKELDVARQLVQSTRERGAAQTGPEGVVEGADEDGDRDRPG